MSSKASDYFNGLPFEERKKLAPLLEEYRILGLKEGTRYTSSAYSGLQTRLNNAKHALAKLEDGSDPEEPMR